jgi:hypothetical protein
MSDMFVLTQTQIQRERDGLIMPFLELGRIKEATI